MRQARVWLAVLAALPLGVRSAGAGGIDELLTRYRRAAVDGGWSRLADGPTLRPGQRHATVPALRRRLAAERGAFAAGEGADDRLYDAALAREVEAFQRRHGLAADAVVGERTRRALAVPVGTRIAQLERARRQRDRPAPRRRWIRVNVADFSLEVLDGDATVLRMPVIVGRASRPTPAFESVVSSVVVNPAWNVPPDLAYLDLLPKIRRDPAYLAARRIDVWESWAPDARPIDDGEVDWARIGRGIERLALRQRPGPGNALGRFLIGMRDERDVFMHDTPSRDLFDAERRTFSSGCIRVADAAALVDEILRSDPRWPADRLAATVARGETVAIEVRDPMPIRIVYETAWADARGGVHFRDDVYGWHRVDRAEPDPPAPARAWPIARTYGPHRRAAAAPPRRPAQRAFAAPIASGRR